MAESAVLRRVERDLARGDSFLALQRLHGLQRSRPTDLAVRARLAAVYRRVGNRVEAGRWAYLTNEVRAGEREAYPDGWRRLRAMRWQAPLDHADEQARRRLVGLLTAAHAAAPRRARVEWRDDGPRLNSQDPDRLIDLLSCLIPAVIAGLVLVLAVIGAVTVIRWIVL